MLPALLGLAPLIGKIFGKAGDIAEELIEDKDKAKEIKAQLTLAGLNIDHDEFKTEMESATKIILAETQSESWMARNWRPMLMLTCVAIIANNYILFPYLSMFTAKAAILELPSWLYELMKIGVGGYIAGRSVEKGLKIWKDK